MGRRRKISEELVARMNELKQAGYSFYKIAKELNLSYVTVAYWIGNYKEKIEASNKKYKAKLKEQIAKATAENKTETQEQQQTQTTPQTTQPQTEPQAGGEAETQEVQTENTTETQNTDTQAQAS